MSPPAVQAGLFDLDDTLIDFQYSRRHGLRAVRELLPGLATVPLEELELVHDEQLHANYLRTLDGSLSDDEARLERVRGICRRYGVQADGTTIAEAAAAYAREKQSNPRLVPGVLELLEALRGRVKIGVVTNGPSARQRNKLESFDIRPEDLDGLAISEDVGAAKPDPAIFPARPRRAGRGPEAGDDGRGFLGERRPRRPGERHGRGLAQPLRARPSRPGAGRRDPESRAGRGNPAGSGSAGEPGLNRSRGGFPRVGGDVAHRGPPGILGPVPCLRKPAAGLTSDLNRGFTRAQGGSAGYHARPAEWAGFSSCRCHPRP